MRKNNEGTWSGKLTIKFDGVHAKDIDELIEKLEEQYEHDYMEFDDIDAEYNPSTTELMDQWWRI